MRRSVRCLSLAFLLTATAAQAKDEPLGDLGRFVPLANVVSDEGDLSVVVVRVLDGWTRAPIAGATVDLVHEAKFPAPNRHAPIAHALTDADGWARVVLDPPLRGKAQPDWMRAHHPDYASSAQFGLTVRGDALLLWPREAARVQVLDPLGRPVARALLDYLLGCGHCPTVLQAHTDGEGVGHVQGIQCESLSQTWLRAEGIYSEYVEHADWLPGDAPLLHRARWARTWEGRVVDDKGVPLEGVAIGTSEFHRGPWAHTDRDGRFRLLGVDAKPGDDMQVGTADCTRKGWQRPFYSSLTLPLPGIAVTLRLPAPPSDPEEWWELPEPPAGTPTTIDVVRADGTPAVQTHVLASRVSDGRTVDDVTDAEGRVILPLAPGTWTVATSPGDAGDERGLYWTRAQVEVPTQGAPPVVRLQRPQPRTMRVALEAPAKSEVHVVTEQFDYDVSEPARAGEAFDVPATGPVHLRVVFAGSPVSAPQVLRVPDTHLGREAQPLVIRPRAPLQVRFTVRGPFGAPIPTWVLPVHGRGDFRRHTRHNFTDEPSATHAFSVAPETSWLGIYPRNTSRFAPKLIPLPRAARDGAQLDLQAITLDPIPERRLRFDVAGESRQAQRLLEALLASRVNLWVVADDMRYEGTIHHDKVNVLAITWSDDRRHTLPPGAVVTVVPNIDTVVPQRIIAPPEGDVVVPWPTGEVLLTVVDERGERPDETRLLFDGTHHMGHENTRILGVAAGTHRVLVSAPGYASQRLAVEVVENATTSQRVVLRTLR